MKRLAVADGILRKKVSNREIKKTVLKALIFSREIASEERLVLQKKLGRILKRNFKSKIKNICIVTGRSRGVNYLGLSRMKIREYQMAGVLTGLKKYSW